MPNVLPIIAMLVATFPSTQAGVMTYSDEASFLDAIAPFYLESFDGLTRADARSKQRVQLQGKCG